MHDYVMSHPVVRRLSIAVVWLDVRRVQPEAVAVVAASVRSLAHDAAWSGPKTDGDREEGFGRQGPVITLL